MKTIPFFLLLSILSCNSADTNTAPAGSTQVDTRLDLSGQRLTSIPDSVFNKTALTYLNLGSSKVVFYPPLSTLIDSNANNIKEIPAALGELVHLHTLILNSNQITTLPNSITKLNQLEILDLSKNKDLDIIKELDKIKVLQNLKVLKIVDVKLNKTDIGTIKKDLPNTKIIVTISEYMEGSIANTRVNSDRAAFTPRVKDPRSRGTPQSSFLDNTKIIKSSELNIPPSGKRGIETDNGIIVLVADNLFALVGLPLF